jgi:hypothetical protein
VWFENHFSQSSRVGGSSERYHRLLLRNATCGADNANSYQQEAKMGLVFHLRCRVSVSLYFSFPLQLTLTFDSSVVLAGIARTIFLKKVQAEEIDKSWAAFEVYVTSIAECNVGIICACAPSLKAFFGRFFNDVTSKYSSKMNSAKSSKQSSNQDSFLTSRSDTIGPMDGLKRNASKIKAKITINRNEKDVAEESSFKDVHEYGLEAISPVAQGYGDGLVLPQEEARIDKKIVERGVGSRVGNTAGPGSWVISPSPSVSSDDEADEANLVQKKHTHDGIPYGLPTREEDDTWGQSLRKELERRSGEEGEETHRSNHQDVMSPPFSEISFSHEPTTVTSLLSPTRIASPPRVRKKLSKERWRQVYEQQARFTPPPPPPK